MITGDGLMDFSGGCEVAALVILQHFPMNGGWVSEYWEQWEYDDDDHKEEIWWISQKDCQLRKHNWCWLPWTEQVRKCNGAVCFTLPWSLVFLVNTIAPRLSPLICPGLEYSIVTSFSQLCIQTICWAQQDIAMYSDSTVEFATVIWH